MFSLSNPIDELKVVFFKTNDNEKNALPKDNTNLIIDDIIESLNLALVYNCLTNNHAIHRINENLTDVCDLY